MSKVQKLCLDFIKSLRIVRTLRFTITTLVLTSLFLGPGISNASNIDSLKQVLANTESTSDKCKLGFSIFEHYVTQGNEDTITSNAVSSIGLCDINSKKDIKIITHILDVLISKGLHDVVIREAGVISDQITDINLKLLFFSALAVDQTLFNSENSLGYFWDKANELLPYATDHDALAKYYYASGTKNHHVGNYLSALQSYRVASTFTDADDFIKTQIKAELINIYIFRIKDYDKAKELLQEMIQVTRKNYDYWSTLFNYWGLVAIAWKTEEYEDLVANCHITLDLHKENNNFRYLGYTYVMMGQGHLGVSNLDSAYYYFNEGVAISLKNNELKELKDNYQGLAKYYVAIGDYDNSINYYQEALDVKTYTDQNLNPKLNREVADILKLQGNYNEAYSMLEAGLKKEKTENINAVTDLKLASEIIENAHDYKQQAEIRIKEKEEQQSRLKKITFGVLLLLFLGSSVLFFLYQNRRKLQVLNDKISARNNELDILTNKQNDTIKYLENFASVAAHDLKAPIRTASAFAGLMSKKSRDKLDKEDIKFLDYIGLSIGKLNIMVDDLLSLSRLDVNLSEKEHIDLNDTVTEIKTQLSSLLKTTNSKIIVESKLPTVKGHSSLINQLFQNLIKNSIVHNKTGNNTVIKVESKSDNAGLYTIRISDNSGGIPEYIIPTMFDLFSSSDKNTGNGIGLATCKKIVNHYGGDISVKVDPGIGTTFNFN